MAFLDNLLSLLLRPSLGDSVGRGLGIFGRLPGLGASFFGQGEGFGQNSLDFFNSPLPSLIAFSQGDFEQGIALGEDAANRQQFSNFNDIASDTRDQFIENSEQGQARLDEAFAAVPGEFDSSGLFTGSQRALDTFKENFNFDDLRLDSGNVREGQRNVASIFQTGRDDVSGAIQASLSEVANVIGLGQQGLRDAKLDPGTILEGIELPSSDLSDVQNQRLGSLASSSESSQQIQQQELASQASAFGGLENLRQQQNSLGFETAGQRGLAAGNIVGQTRAEESAIEQFTAGLQGSARTVEEQINAALEQSIGQLSGTQGNIIGQLGSNQASILAALTQGQAGFEPGFASMLDQLAKSNQGLRLGEIESLTNLEKGVGDEATQAALTEFTAGLNRANTLSGIAGTGLNANAGLASAFSDTFGFNQSLFGNLTPFLFPGNSGGGGSSFGISSPLGSLEF